MEQNIKKDFIIADHMRAVCFLISSGVQPSGKQRGYILRKLMRRLLSASLALGINLEREYFVDLTDSVISIFKEVYHEIEENRELIINTLSLEAEKYKKAVEVGKKEWTKILQN